MPTSVMPKGVEHVLEYRAPRRDCEMPTSVMPKGVEHRSSRTRTEAQAVIMPTSVMPKGVEHNRHASVFATEMP